MAGLKHLVILQKYQTVLDSDGNNIESVAQTINRWVYVKRIGGGRTTVSGQTVLKDSIEFTCGFSYDFTPNSFWRVTYDGVKHTVQSIVKDGERRFNWKIVADATDGG